MRVLRRLFSSAVDHPVKPFESIPGPTALPIFGSLWKYFPIVGNYDLGMLHITGLSMYEEFGGIMRENLMNGEVIVHVFEPEDIEKVYKSEGKYPSRKSHIALAHYRLSRPELYNTGGILPTNGSEWWRLRSTFQKSLTRIQDVRLFLPISNIIIDEFLNTFIGEEVIIYDFLPKISKLNLELTWATLFGNRLGSFHSKQLQSNFLASDLIEATETVNSSILRADMTEGIWTKIKTPTYKRLEKCLTFMESVVEEQLSTIKNKMEEHEKEQMNGNYSLINNYFKCEGVDIKDIRGMISDLILGGIDTTSYTTCFLIYNLSRHRGIQEHLKDEALRLLPNTDSPVTSSVLNDAIYARAILKESFRLNPIATGISRILGRDEVLSGYLVPKDTLIITHNLEACRLEKHFKIPTVFLPERWIRGSKEYSNVSPYLVLPFSHGIRTCIARRLAEQNLLSFLLKVGRRYSLDWKGDRLGIVTPLICKPDGPVSVKFKSW